MGWSGLRFPCNSWYWYSSWPICVQSKSRKEPTIFVQSMGSTAYFHLPCVFSRFLLQLLGLDFDKIRLFLLPGAVHEHVLWSTFHTVSQPLNLWLSSCWCLAQKTRWVEAILVYGQHINRQGRSSYWPQEMLNWNRMGQERHGTHSQLWGAAVAPVGEKEPASKTDRWKESETLGPESWLPSLKTWWPPFRFSL